MTLEELFQKVPSKTLKSLILCACIAYDDAGREVGEDEIYEELKRLVKDHKNHPIDCKCAICR